MPPPPPGSHNTNPTEAYFEPNTSSSSNPYAQAQGGTLHQATALIPQPPQIMSPTSAGGTVVVSAMTPHPVMAVHAAPPGVNGVPMMNGGLLSGPTGHTHSTTSKSSTGGSGTLHGIHTQTPLLQSPPPGHAHLPSASPHGHGTGGGGLLQPVGGVSHHQTQYVYASAATAVGTMASPHFVYKFHQVHPSAGRAYSTY